MHNYLNLPKFNAFYVDLEGNHVLAAQSDDLDELIKSVEALEEAKGRPVLVYNEFGSYVKVRTNQGEWKSLVRVEIE